MRTENDPDPDDETAGDHRRYQDADQGKSAAH